MPRRSVPSADPDAGAGDALDAYAAAPPRVRLGIGAVVLIAILALGGTVAVGMLRGSSEPVEDVVAAVTDDVYVHVGGAVREPGLYRLPARARVVDAIAAASGFADDAARDAVNLARAVSDGEQLVVPSTTDGIGGAPAGGVAADGTVNLNTATEADLDTLPRIGPAMAERIVEWRDANGRFTSVDDLLAVPGIGEKMLETLRPLVGV